MLELQDIHYHPATSEIPILQNINLIAQKKFNAVLLDGVTGSGKTEVYFQAILETLKINKQVLVLLPEIYLSVEWSKRFNDNFGLLPLLWHSSLSNKDRMKTWHEVNQGKINTIVGARSALFLPYKNLGLIIIDEEHDHSYKQEDGVLYNARDMALLRAKIEKIASMSSTLLLSPNALMSIGTKGDKLELIIRYSVQSEGSGNSLRSKLESLLSTESSIRVSNSHQFLLSHSGSK